MTHIPKDKRTKWDKKSEKLILVGFYETIKGYRLCDKKTGKISTSRDVHIFENKNTIFDGEETSNKENIEKFTHLMKWTH